MIASNPVYRNNRPNFYSEKGPDSVSVGTIINVFKTKSNKKSYDSEFVPTQNAINGTSSYVNVSGNGQPEINPDYQYRGYLYCDGSEYSIRDYPLLYAAIGNEYGGTPSNGITVLTSGSGYSSSATITFSAAPPGGVTAQGSPIIQGGVVKGITVSKAGVGYTTPPTITFTGGGAGATFEIRLNTQGSISPITQDNVLEHWPDSNMGTFKVPDLLAKKIVGYGPVYGSGSPVIGNIDITIGLSSIGGKWYLDEDSQKGQFNLGAVTTTGYTSVTDTLGGNIIGSETIIFTLQEKRLSGAPQHTHLLLHSEAPNIQGGKPGITYDSYLTGYKTGTGKIEGFTPSGGIALTHNHALLKKANTSTTFATYDLYNYTGGDPALGTSNPGGNIYASGGSGSFELVTFTPNPTFRFFNTSSQIGGRTILTSGTPTYDYQSSTFTSPGTYTYSFNTAVDEVTFTVQAGGASGAVYDQQGNDGSNSSVTLGSGQVVITAGGGIKGGAAGSTTGGSGGNAGTNSVTGSSSGIFSIQQNQGGALAGYSGGSGQGGPFWKAVNPTENPSGTWGGAASANGSAGKYLSVNQIVDLSATTISYPSTGNFSVLASSTNYTINAVTVELYGGRGANCGNYGGLYGCTTGVGGSGKYFKLSLKNPGGSSGTVFGFYPGQGGLAAFGSATATYGTAGGGSGGDGYQSNDGGGGAAATVVTGPIGGTVQIVAGAGGGGGGGGAGEGQCGDNATGNATTDGVQAVTSPLFSGAGGSGGNYGCTGGGGGGGGGGVGLQSQTGAGQGPEGGAGAGGSGGGGGGTGGHGGGYGGARGLSSYRSDIFDLVSSGDSGDTNGRIVGQVQEDRSYWSSGGGAGGSGGRISGNIIGADLQASGISSATIVVGSGGPGVTRSIINSNSVASSSGGNGTVTIQTAVITGYQGGTTSISIGDIIESASSGPEIYSSGTGVGTAGGFKLPTTQLPQIVITPQGSSGGAGASASCTVANGVVTGINLISGGNGYTSPPKVRFLGGSGKGTTATTTINSAGNVTSITLGSGTGGAYEKYVRIGGTELERYIVLLPQDCTNVEKIGVKCARGNNINGGEKPDDSADELRVYYNVDGSDNFPDNQFIGVLVPRPSDADIASNYDGNGVGDTATKWYTYTVTLPQGAQTTGVKFKILQKRTAASGANDNGGNNDHFGICEFLYDYKQISEVQFVPTPGELVASAGSVSYTIEGPGNSAYPAGIGVNDITFNMTAGTPLIPSPFLDPVKDIPLVEPYMLTKYLIKAY
jgi:hypothetical protein